MFRVASAGEAPEDDQDEPLDVHEESRESDDDIGDLPSVPPVSRTFINYRQGRQSNPLKNPKSLETYHEKRAEGLRLRACMH